ncbi:MAG: fibrobacter succinogenes major paralogous domain-containing protein [Bacteroidetes bacterium]|nr:fibrobacter succinogenes major paralogous domain-containing protein [Bacteroidota bacterium]
MKKRNRFWNYSLLVMGVLLMLTNNCKKDDDNNNQVKDIDGNVYQTVIIGTQVWMVENLKTTKYNDGTPIPLVTDGTNWWNHTPEYCWYNNDIANKEIYGALYNWFAVDTASNGGKNIAPIGWHVPTEAEWTILTTYLGGDSLVGGKLKEKGTIHWLSPNTSATNESGFTALPGGYREYTGSFYYIGDSGYWWSSSNHELYAQDAWCRHMNYYYSYAGRAYYGKQYGFSVRCVKD